MNSIVLRGIDGSNPLGFLAGLGAQVVSDSARLSWTMERGWNPKLDIAPDSFAQAIESDLIAWSNSPVLNLHYEKLEKQGVKVVRSLKPPVAAFRAWANSLPSDSRFEPYSATLVAEGVVENDGLTSTAFDFTSRNQQFLDMIRQIRDALITDHILAVCNGDHTDRASAPTMGWDPRADAPGAIFPQGAPVPDPALEWLAFRGLALLPTYAIGARLRTAATTGRRKQGAFIWPIWTAPIPLPTVRSLMGNVASIERSAAVLKSRGIVALYSSALSKGADGYAGIFGVPQFVVVR